MNDAAHSIPKQPQRQDALDDQIDTLIIAAERLGCYDAQDWLRKLVEYRKAYWKRWEHM